MGTDRRRVWVTRTEPGASRTADVLERHGYAVFKQPLLRIEAAAEREIEELMARLGNCDIVIALSSHAVRIGLPWAEMPRLGRARWVTVGARTAETLADFGIVAEVPTTHNSEGILASGALSHVAGKRVGLLCGVGGRALLGAALVERGAQLERFEVYRRVPEAVDVEQLRDALPGIGVALVSSSEAGPPLASLLGEADLPGPTLLAGSNRIAKILRSLELGPVAVSAGPGDKAMLEALAVALPARP